MKQNLSHRAALDSSNPFSDSEGVHKKGDEALPASRFVSNCKRILSAWAGMLCIEVFGSPAALAQDQTLQDYGAAFQANLPADWTFQPGFWAYIDTASCFLYGPSCFGNNPTTPYANPLFTDPATQLPSSIFQMLADEAVVILFRTPPQVRYFAFTQYMMNKGVTTMTGPVFGSLSDSLSNFQIGTTGSTTPGTNVFNQYSALVWTGDMNTFATVQSTFMAAGLPAQAVNLVPLPVNLPVYPLHACYGPGCDTYQMLMRAALPADAAAYASYQAEQPFIVQKVGPTQHLAPAPAPTIGYAPEISGLKEDPAGKLAKSLTSLATAITKNYSATYTFKNQQVTYSSRVGWDCIGSDTACSADNHDALYSIDSPNPVTFKGPDDFVMFVGVNHQKTGKATYLNHSVYDTVRLAGILAVDDRQLTSASALYHAGITNPRDPRAASYANMYAYMVAYNCNGRSYCVQIPPPTPDSPVGLPPGSPFYLLGRSYSDPITKVRPSTTEVVQHKVFVATKK